MYHATETEEKASFNVSLFNVYAPTKICEMEEKMFYTKLESTIDQCSLRDVLIVLGNFNTVTGTDRADYEMCIGHHGSGTRNSNSLLLNLARFQM